MSPTSDQPSMSSFDDNFHYALAEIESIIKKDVPFFLKVRKPLDDELLLGAKAEIEAVVESIKIDLDTIQLHFKDERFRADYIQFHQRALLRLAGSMVQYMEPSPEVAGVKAETLIQILYQALNELLAFIKKHFVKYLSNDAFVPHNYQQTVCINIRPRVQLLRERLAATKTDPELAAIILAPLESLLTSNVKDYSFNEILYLKEYKYRLLELLDNKSGDVEECLLMTLYRLDFNSDEFYYYNIKRLSKILYDCSNEEGCLESLTVFQKQLKQTPQYPFLSYRPEQPSLKVQINNWLQEEISYYEGKQKANGTENLAGNQATITSSLTVAEIAYFLRILVGCGMLRVKRQLTMIFRFVSTHLATENTSAISVHSLNKEYHKPDVKTMERMIVRLNFAIDFIKKDIDSITA